MNNFVKRLSCSLLAFIFFISGVASSAQAATETSLCRDTGVAFVFFNGVQTTKPQAEIAKQELQSWVTTLINKAAGITLISTGIKMASLEYGK